VRIIPVYVLIFLLSFYVIGDTDLGWHLRVGEYIFNYHKIPQNFLFSFTNPNAIYIHYSWLAELFMYVFYRFLGMWGISIFYAIILTATVIVIAKTCRFFTNKRIFMPYFILLTPLAHAVAGGRTIVFGLFFFSLTYYLLIRYQKHNSKTVWLIPSIFIIWTNFHASFTVGLLLITIFFTAKTIASSPPKKFSGKHAVILVALSFLATLINPHFVDIWSRTILTTTIQLSNLKSINPTWESSLDKGTIGVIYIFSATTIGIFALLSRRIPLQQKMLVWTFIITPLITSRFLFVLLPILSPIVYTAISETTNKFVLKSQRSFFLKLITAVIFLVFIPFSIISPLEARFAYASFENYSHHLATYSPNKNYYKNWSQPGYLFYKNNLANKNILTDANWGGLFILDEPQTKVFYYGALDNLVIDKKPFPFEYLTIVNALGNWQEKIDKYPIEVVLLPINYPIVKELQNNDNWKKSYEDNLVVILMKV